MPFMYFAIKSRDNDVLFKVVITRAHVFFRNTTHNKGTTMTTSLPSLDEIQLELANTKQSLQQLKNHHQNFLNHFDDCFKMPCRGIADLAISLKLAEKDKQKKHQLAAIVQSATQLLSFISQVIEQTQIKNDFQPLCMQAFKMVDVVEDIKKLLAAEIIYQNIKLDCHYDENLPKEIMTDRNCLFRILLNLIVFCFTHSLENNLNIYFKEISRKNKKVLLNITIARTSRDLPIEFFKQQGNQTHRHLTTAKQLIEKLGGTIYLNASNNKSGFVCSVLVAIK